MASDGFGLALRTASAALPPRLRTRFAPAPTGALHLGHVASAMVVWEVARTSGGQVILRIEDHDRQRSRPAFETALVDDLAALGFAPDEPTIAALRTGEASSYRQSDNDAAYAAAIAALEARDLVYGCDCTRSTFVAWATTHGQRWTGPGCPGQCSGRALSREVPGVTWRVRLGEGSERWTDLVLGTQVGAPSAGGDLIARDRPGNWTYGFCVVVDDLRHGIDLVIRGEDLLEATPAQIRLGTLLGRAKPPKFLHHPLIRRADGRKLSKADGATSIGTLLASGTTSNSLRERAAAAIGWADAGS